MGHSSHTHHQNVDQSEEEAVAQARKCRRLNSQVSGAMGVEEQAVSPESLDSEDAS